MSTSSSSSSSLVDLNQNSASSSEAFSPSQSQSQSHFSPTETSSPRRNIYFRRSEDEKWQEATLYSRLDCDSDQVTVEYVLHCQNELLLETIPIALAIENIRMAQPLMCVEGQLIEFYCEESKEWVGATVVKLLDPAQGEDGDGSMEILYIRSDGSIVQRIVSKNSLAIAALGTHLIIDPDYISSDLSSTSPEDPIEEKDERPHREHRNKLWLELLPGRKIEIQRRSGKWVKGVVAKIGSKAMLVQFHDPEGNTWVKKVGIKSHHLAQLGTHLKRRKRKQTKAATKGNSPKPSSSSSKNRKHPRKTSSRKSSGSGHNNRTGSYTQSGPKRVSSRGSISRSSHSIQAPVKRS